MGGSSVPGRSLHPLDQPGRGRLATWPGAQSRVLLLEALVALPADMFYNTGIATYVWILSNAKPSERRGTIQLIDGSGDYAKMRKSLGSKRNWLDEPQINALVRLYGEHAETDNSKVFPTSAFGYRRITVERLLRLNVQASEERLGRLADENAIQKLGEAERHQIEGACRRLDPEHRYTNREAVLVDLDAALKDADYKPRAPVMKTIRQRPVGARRGSRHLPQQEGQR